MISLFWVSNQGRFAYYRAVCCGDQGIVECLLNAKADVTVKEEQYGKTAEKMAEEMAQAKILELIRKATK